jgi:YVTN family beta-propeller protein
MQQNTQKTLVDLSQSQQLLQPVQPLALRARASEVHRAFKRVNEDIPVGVTEVASDATADPHGELTECLLLGCESPTGRDLLQPSTDTVLYDLGVSLGPDSSRTDSLAVASASKLPDGIFAGDDAASRIASAESMAKQGFSSISLNPLQLLGVAGAGLMVGALGGKVSVDTTAPAVAVTGAADDAGAVTGNVSSGGTTDDTTLVLSGTTEAGATVAIYDGSTLLGHAIVTGTTWTYSATVANGTTYQFNAKATDAAGNTSAATTNYTVTGDTTAPNVVAVSGSHVLNFLDTSFPVSPAPYAVAFSPDGGRAYVAALSGNVSVIDTATDTVVATIGGLSRANGVAVSPNGNFIYVSDHIGNTVTVIDAVTRTVVTVIPVPNAPTGLVVSPNGSFVYVGTAGGNDVPVIDTATNTLLGPINGIISPWSFVLSPDGTRGYVAQIGYNRVSVFDLTTNSLITNFDGLLNGVGPDFDQPVAVVISPDGRELYIANNSNGTNSYVSVVDVATQIVTTTITGFDSLKSLAMSLDGQRVYAVDSFNNSVSVIDTATNTVTTTITGFAEPFSIAILPDGSRGFVANNISNTVSVIDTTDPLELVLVGTNYSDLLEAGETAATDIKARLDWSKLTWDIDSDNTTTTDVSFVLSDILSASVADNTHLRVVLTDAKNTALRATAGFGGATADTLDIAAGFFRDAVGNALMIDYLALPVL